MKSEITKATLRLRQTRPRKVTASEMSVPVCRAWWAKISLMTRHDHFAFFAVAFDEGPSQAGRYLPVDALDIVAGCVFTHLFELDARPAKDGLVLTGHQGVDRPAGAQMDLLDFLNQIRR
jgi:hypothetical protein